MTDEQLKRYIGAVEQVREARAEAPDAAMRRKIAEELGLSEADLAAAVVAGEASLARGEGFVARAVWDEALTQLQEADALLPDDLRVVYALARAWFGRYRDRHSAADRVHALVECRRCLQLDPRHQGALNLIGDLETAQRTRRRRRQLIAAVAVASLTVVGAGTTYFVVAPARPTCPDGSSYCTIPASLQIGELGDDIVFSPSLLQVSPRSLRLELQARLTHRGQTELGLFRLAVRYVDARGKVLGEKALDAHPSFAPALRPGDTATFYLSEAVPIGTRGAVVSAGERRTEPAAASYGDGEVVPVAFDPPAPSHVELSAVYRSRSARHYDGKTVVEGVAVVTNTGQGVIRGLEMNLQGLDADHRPVGSPARETVVYSIMPPMLPGERRLVKTFLYVTGQVASEILIATKVE